MMNIARHVLQSLFREVGVIVQYETLKEDV